MGALEQHQLRRRRASNLSLSTHQEFQGVIQLVGQVHQAPANTLCATYRSFNANSYLNGSANGQNSSPTLPYLALSVRHFPVHPLPTRDGSFHTVGRTAHSVCLRLSPRCGCQSIHRCFRFPFSRFERSLIGTALAVHISSC